MCRENEVILYYYGEASNEKELIEHLANCPTCKEFFESLQEVSHAYRQSQQVAVDDGLSVQIKTAVSQHMGQPQAGKRVAANRNLWAAVIAALLLISIWRYTVFLHNARPEPKIVNVTHNENIEWQTDISQEIETLSNKIQNFGNNMYTKQSELDQLLTTLEQKISDLDNQILNTK